MFTDYLQEPITLYRPIAKQLDMMLEIIACGVLHGVRIGLGDILIQRVGFDLDPSNGEARTRHFGGTPICFHEH